MVTRVDTAPHGVATTTPLADWLGFVEPAPPGEDNVSSPIRNLTIRLQLQQTGDENGVLRVDTAPHGVATPTPLADCCFAGVRGASVTRGG